MDTYNSSYEHDPTLEYKAQGSRFDVMRELMEELDEGSQKLIKKLLKKLEKKAEEEDNVNTVEDYVLKWVDEIASFLRRRSMTPEEDSVDWTSRDASEMELATKLERFKVKTLDVLADVKDQGSKQN